MKTRYSYPLLFLLPSAMVAFLAAFAVVGAGAGVLWIFVYGDDPWPESSGPALMTLAVIVSLATLASLMLASYSYGKQREPDGMARRHVAWVVGISFLLPSLVLLHQWQVGNLG